MTKFWLSVLSGVIGGVLGAYLEQKFGPIVILGYVIALIVILVCVYLHHH